MYNRYVYVLPVKEPMDFPEAFGTRVAYQASASIQFSLGGRRKYILNAFGFSGSLWYWGSIEMNSKRYLVRRQFKCKIGI